MERRRCILTPVGPLTITATARGVTAIRFGGTPDNAGPDPAERDAAGMAGPDCMDGPDPAERDAAGMDGACACAPYAPDALLRQAVRELEEYFAGTRRAFTFPLAPAGTPFQLAVWQALRTIPYGQTRSYGQIAAQIGREKACRAVGMANHRNPLAIVVPCHRVVGSTGAPVGYAGGVPVKMRLLALEAAHTPPGDGPVDKP